MKKKITAVQAINSLIDAMANKIDKDEKNKRATEMALTFLSRRNPFDDTCQSAYAFMLMEFQDKKGDEAIQGLAGFYIYAIDNIGGLKGSQAIETTFAHDLGGRNDEFCLPKSDSYRQTWLDEIEKRGWK